MDCTNELLQLAHLMRVGAETSRLIASLRASDMDAIERLADRADEMARELEEIAETRAPSF